MNPVAETTQIDQPLSISDAIGSGLFAQVRSDQLKDTDSLRWIYFLEKSEQKKWLEKLKWIRWIDRLAERDFFIQNDRAIKSVIAFCESPASSSQFPLETMDLQEMRQAFSSDQWSSITKYAQSIWKYTFLIQKVTSFEDYLVRADELSGTFFQTLPHVDSTNREYFRQLGIVDQLFNDLRDLYSDILTGVYNLPAEIAGNQKPYSPEHLHRFCEILLPIYLLPLQKKPKAFHPVLELMTSSCFLRYQRISDTYKSVNFDAFEFSKKYWASVEEFE